MSAQPFATFKNWVSSAGVDISQLSNDSKIKYRKIFDSISAIPDVKSLVEFENWVVSAGVEFDELNNDSKIQYRKDFDTKDATESDLQLVRAQMDALIWKDKAQTLERDNFVAHHRSIVGVLQHDVLSLTLRTDDVLAEQFESAKLTENFWLAAGTPASWSHPKFEKMSQTNKKVTESRKGGIQDTWNQMVKVMQSNTWEFQDTHKSAHEGLTQDGLMCLKDRPLSCVSVGLLIELVCQDVSGFPDKRHKAKFVRDLKRLHVRRGCRGHLFGLVTDLSRVVIMKVSGAASDMSLERTAEETGHLVLERLRAFVCASSENLGIQPDWHQVFTVVPKIGSKVADKLAVRPGELLGAGAQGTVYKAVIPDNKKAWFLKVHMEAEAFTTECQVLTALKDINGVVKLLAVDLPKLTFLAEPVCEPLGLQRHKIQLFKFGIQFVDVLLGVHQAGFAHRDARGGNLLVKNDDASGYPSEAILADFACAARLEKRLPYQGALHFAANAVLMALASGETDITFTAAMDLESLVKTIWDLAGSVPCGVNKLANNYGSVLQWWQAAETAVDESGRVVNVLLVDMLGLARAADYTGLKNRMEQCGRLAV